ncbi:hypothetical protein BDN72DRAFT_825113 [Pluteus cervinus]|uniref:Uncharacterized protein n=1 Tax=Pluteus cervinus TaxID=181527 RepID=A0ACD3AGU8_9AGAR|nr:hypothetical protein BDN72DRAFT_825113 [Pluteus cervinus]
MEIDSVLTSSRVPFTANQPVTFTPCDLYPCSQACSGFNRACASCSTSVSVDTQAFEKAQRLHVVRESLRATYDHFLHAARSRVIDDTVEVASKAPGPQRRVVGFRDGILLGPPPSSADWGYGWEHNATNRPLQLCHLQCQLSWNQDKYYLIFHPILTTTPFIPLSGSLPIPPGSSITLLPFGTPAYFLARYTGPISALTAQFDEAFRGRGLGSWHSHFRGKEQNASNGNLSEYIIAWISVENKQGEDKGITIIYPTELSLSFISSSVRPPLHDLPVLPIQLQPSPEACQSVPTSPTHTTNVFPPAPCLTSSRPSLPSSPTVDSVRAFRSLTLSKGKHIRGVASEVGGYVDAIARERERERERLKREREGALSGSPKLSRAASTTSTPSYPQSHSQDPTVGPPPPGIPPAPPPLSAHIAGTGSSVPTNTLLATHQSFYPSPPQMVTPTLAANPTSPVVFSPSLPQAMQVESSEPSVKAATPPSEQPKAAVYSETTYDPFGNIESGWDQAPQGFDMDMDFGMDMNMGFNMANLSAGGEGGGNFNDHTGSLNFEDAFTDDDFNFFDRPSSKAIISPMPVPQPSLSPTKGNPLALNIPLMFPDISNPLSGLLPTGQPSPWAVSALGDPFTPRFGEQGDRIPPELLPPSPGDTPRSHSVPPTPTVHLDLESLDIKSTPQSSNFDPIPFSSYHRLADGKYTIGKFALPSPPSERDDAMLSVSSPTPSNGWRLQYDAATDPRIGVVRRLIGVKRKFPHEHLPRNSSKLSPWVHEIAEWEPTRNDDEGEDSEAESDEDELQEPDTPIVSRPTTPPPSYLPLGPSLIHTHFQHTHLLSLSSPLRLAGASIVSSHMATVAPIPSVPTPVSPAAALGAASEKSKSLEAAAFMVAQEVVENYVWASAWRAGALSSKRTVDPWLSDAKVISHLFGLVPGLEGPLDLKSLFCLEDLSSNPKSIQVMDMPSLAVGKGDAVIQVLPAALRFWEKLGLGPRGGPKDFTAFVLFEDEGEERRNQVASWLSNFAVAYQEKHFGVLTPGRGNTCPVDGLVPMRFDPSFRKVLAHFVSNIPRPDISLVFFIVTPATAMTLGSHQLRIPMVTLARLAPNKVSYSFTPYAPLDVADKDTFLHIGYQISPCDKWIIAASIDQRGEAHDLGVWLTQTSGDGDPDGDVSQEAYVVNKVWEFAAQFSSKAGVEWRMVIARLGVIPELELEAWRTLLDSKVTHSPDSRPLHVTLVCADPDAPWAFLTAKPMPMPTPKQPSVPGRSLSSSVSKSAGQGVFTDISSLTYAIFPTTRSPISVPSSPLDPSLSIPYICEPVSSSPSPSPSPSMDPISPSQSKFGIPELFTSPILPHATSVLVRVPCSPSPMAITMLHIHLLETFHTPTASHSSASRDESQLHSDLTRNYYELSVLSRSRWGLNTNPILPFHLGAVEAMRVALDRDRVASSMEL